MPRLKRPGSGQLSALREVFGTATPPTGTSVASSRGEEGFWTVFGTESRPIGAPEASRRGEGGLLPCKRVIPPIRRVHLPGKRVILSIIPSHPTRQKSHPAHQEGLPPTKRVILSIKRVILSIRRVNLSIRMVILSAYSCRRRHIREWHLI